MLTYDERAMTKALATFVSALAFCTIARALPEYPEALQKATGAPCLPHCNVCHRDDNAGSGTVDRPFAVNMEQIGGLNGNERSVANAVTLLAQAQTDSDGDGAGDIDEISMGQDPNDPYETSLCGPRVGCALGAGTSSLSPALALLALARVLRRRRR